MKKGRRRALLLVITSAAGLLGSVALAVSETGCDTGNAASPQNDANRDSGIGTGSATDSGTVADGTVDDAADGNVQDTGIVEAGLNGCTTYVDHTADLNVNLQWDLQVNNLPDHCSKIAAGSSVTWVGSFSAHPLEALGGDTPNPITGSMEDAGAIQVVFPSAGDFGYHCINHPNRMFGAILVVSPTDAGGD